MYENIGSKIKGLAVAEFVVIAILSIIGGIGLMSIGEQYILIGGILLFGGPFISWIASLVLYGFGEIVDNSSDIVNYLKMKKYNTKNADNNTNKKNDNCDNENEEKSQMVQRMISNGIITEEEYRNAVANGWRPENE